MFDTIKKFSNKVFSADKTVALNAEIERLDASNKDLKNEYKRQSDIIIHKNEVIKNLHLDINGTTKELNRLRIELTTIKNRGFLQKLKALFTRG